MANDDDTPRTRTDVVVEVRGYVHQARRCIEEHTAGDMYVGDPGPLNALDDLADACDDLLAEVEALRAERDRWQEREASVCPEDFSFEEVIESLRAEVERERAKSWLREGIISQLDAYHARVAKLEEALRPLLAFTESLRHLREGEELSFDAIRAARAALEENDDE